MNVKRSIGIVVILVVVATLWGWNLKRSRDAAPGAGDPGGSAATARPPAEIVTIRGLVGGEKTGFLDDPEVKEILRSTYGLVVDAKKAGSIEMVLGDDVGEQDFLWPSNQVAHELYLDREGRQVRSEVIFNSPIVLYSWDIVTQALVVNEIVRKEGDTYWVSDFPKLANAVADGKKWSDLGLPQLYGKVTIFSTDPTRSSSGNMFAGLVATVLNDGEVVTAETVGAKLPVIDKVFGRMGRLESSSADLFDQFLKMGVGANPIIAAYENQMLEFAVGHPEYKDVLNKRIRILYPRPTVWSNHVLIAVNEKGAKLIDALKDPRLQQIAWTRHGFRSGFSTGQVKAAAAPMAGIPESIDAVVPMPTAKVMQQIIDTLNH
jgi:hypothetical protein